MKELKHKKVKKEKDTFVVYAAILDNEIVYIGEGLIGRELHCTSGTSSVYGLNCAHFIGKTIDVEILAEVDTKQEAERIEREMILKHTPRFNKDRFSYNLSQVLKTYRRFVNGVSTKRVFNLPIEKLVSHVTKGDVSCDISQFIKLPFISDHFERVPNSLGAIRLSKQGIEIMIDFHHLIKTEIRTRADKHLVDFLAKKQHNNTLNNQGEQNEANPN